MERSRIIQILESYRSGEGLEADPEVREALEAAARDTELSSVRKEIEAFDEAFGAHLRSIEVPEDLFGNIMATAGPLASGETSPKESRRVMINWFHPAAFGAAAAIILLLALTFTFWDPPQSPSGAHRTMTAGINPVLQMASSLYANRNPSFKSHDQDDILAYIRSHDGQVPGALPHGFSWDRTFACDVLDVEGVKVSMICFIGPDMKNAMHLFTFRRVDFPEIEIPAKPTFQNTPEAAAAAWTRGEQILILFSDGGEENIRSVLDI